MTAISLRNSRSESNTFLAVVGKGMLDFGHEQYP